MKKIRSKTELQDGLDEDFTWRLHEIQGLKGLLRSHSKDSLKDVLIKSLIMVSYSHWEGFIKNSTRLYLMLISHYGLNRSTINEKLSRVFLVYELMNKNCESPSQKIEFLNVFFGDVGYKHNIVIDNLVATKGNLNSEVFHIISNNICADVSSLDTKMKFLDSVLLAKRNAFAHGEKNYELKNAKDAIEIADQVIEMIKTYKSMIENMSDNEVYKREI